ncbi:alginate lyase [Coprinopsis cinerea okayama7|uniref:Alginate lyase n=1 Tax=Coprinopsis cinerea (strain Okayama-7 / 130 / ATCC MYA-4618 / FGSC 9003) TaxID=240176 RepID=A8PA08_COPC7|nr:alginate lyase [Coprinopsis cinerea okayama7\|eukprot:XP_001839877.1 alginate lyase [Coprinopsis cinerea okayama7\
MPAPRFLLLALALLIGFAVAHPAPDHAEIARRQSVNSLFPVQGYQRAWSTSNVLGSALSLNDNAFRPRNAMTNPARSYGNSPDGRRSLIATFPQGAVTLNSNPAGGFSFYAPGPDGFSLTGAREVTFAYSVYFPSGFGWQKGGKLPGLYGGNSDGEAIGCSGGRHSSACFSARFMWRANGAGELYTYLPPHADNKRYCNRGDTHCNPQYGDSVGRGAFHFRAGGWTTIAQRVRLNDVGQSNGEIQVWANGQSVIDLKGLQLRTSSSGNFRGMQMQTFFGGSSPDFASPKWQQVFFRDFSIAIVR